MKGMVDAPTMRMMDPEMEKQRLRSPKMGGRCLHAQGRAKAGPTKVQGKGYKRVEVMLNQEAAIALRFLMRDGRTAKEVIEAALIEAKRQRLGQPHAATPSFSDT